MKGAFSQVQKIKIAEAAQDSQAISLLNKCQSKPQTKFDYLICTESAIAELSGKGLIAHARQREKEKQFEKCRIILVLLGQQKDGDSFLKYLKYKPDFMKKQEFKLADFLQILQHQYK